MNRLTHSRNRPVMLDLFSGLGGASQVMRERGWRVISVDIERRFKPTIVADVRSLPLKPFHVDLLWASPPCQEFSKWGLRCFFPNPPLPDISLALGTLKVIERFAPRTWIVENVWSSRRWLTPIFGPVRGMVIGHAFWSNQCLMLPCLQPHKGGRRAFVHLRKDGVRFDEVARRYIHDGAHGASIIPKLRHMSDEAAKIPHEISEAVCLAVERKLECQPV